MFELTVLLANLIVPATIMVAAIGLAWRMKQPSIACCMVLGTSAAIAIAVAYGLRNGFAIWPEDAWQRIPLATLMVGIIGSTRAHIAPARSIPYLLNLVALVGIALAATYVVLPSGEGWEELAKSALKWYALFLVAMVTAQCLIDCLPSRAVGWFGLALIPWTMISAYLCSESFVKVTEPIIAVATTIGLGSLANLRKTDSHAVRSILAPALFTVFAGLAHAKFYDFADTPEWYYQLLVVTPSLMAAVTLLIVLIARNRRKIISPK